jgi:hypothetical protein
MVWQPLPTLEEVLGWSFEDMALKAGELFSELKLTLNLSSDDIQDLVHRFRKHALNGSLFLVLGAQQGFYTAQPDDIRLPQFAWATVWAFAVSINEAASKGESPLTTWS